MGVGTPVGSQITLAVVRPNYYYYGKYARWSVTQAVNSEIVILANVSKQHDVMTATTRRTEPAAVPRARSYN